MSEVKNIKGKINMPKYPDYEDVVILIDMLGQPSEVNQIIHSFGKKLAVKYWSNIKVHEYMHPHDVFRGIMHNLELSNWFEIIGIEDNVNEVKIILKMDIAKNTRKVRCKFLNGFIEELTNNGYNAVGLEIIQHTNNGTYAFIFQNRDNQEIKETQSCFLPKDVIEYLTDCGATPRSIDKIHYIDMLSNTLGLKQNHINTSYCSSLMIFT